MEASASDEEGPNKKEKKPKERLRRKRWFNIHHLKVDKRRPCWEMYCIVWMYYFVSMIPLAVFTFSYLFSLRCTDLFPEKSGILVDFGDVVKKCYFVLKYSASLETLICTSGLMQSCRRRDICTYIICPQRFWFGAGLRSSVLPAGTPARTLWSAEAWRRLNVRQITSHVGVNNFLAWF